MRFAKFLRKAGNEVTVVGRRLSADMVADSRLVSEMNKYGPVPIVIIGKTPRLSGPATTRIFNMLGAPDNLVLSIPNYLRELKRVINAGDIDCIVTSNAPSAYILGALIKQDLGISWIADFCDLWTGAPGLFVPTRLHRYLQERIEVKTLSQADGISYTSESWDSMLRARYPDGKLCYVPNGYDPEEFMIGNHIEKSRRGLTFCFVGTIYGDMDLVFLNAFLDFLKEIPHANESVKLKILGTVDPDKRREIEGLYEFRDNIEMKGLLPSYDTIKELTESDFLVYDLGTGNTAKYDHLPARLPLYIGSGKPTIACCIPGSLSDRFFRRFGCWRVIESGNRSSIKRCFEEAWDLYSSGMNIQDLKTWNKESQSLRYESIVGEFDRFIQEVHG